MQVSSRINSTINSTRHAITSYSLLNCKKDRCFYFELCHIKEEIKTYPYGAYFPIELIKGKDIEEAYKEDFKCVLDLEKLKLIHDLVIIDLQEMRINNLVSMTGAVPGVRGSGCYVILPHVLQRYQSELLGRRIKLYKQIKGLKVKT